MERDGVWVRKIEWIQSTRETELGTLKARTIVDIIADNEATEALPQR